MLTFKQLKVDWNDPRCVSELAAYYVGTYYTHSAPGKFHGRAAAKWGLASVDKKTLCRLFLGRSPDGKRQLVKLPRPSQQQTSRPSKQPKKKKDRREAHVPGYDLTFSAPKSVSALWALSDENGRRLIERAMDESVRETLDWMERELKLARSGKNGKHHDFAHLFVATFTHTSARNHHDPDIHTHCVVANVCQNIRDQKFSKVNSQMLYRWFRTMGPMFRNSLYLKLRELLGVEAYRPIVQKKPAGWFELCGVSTLLTSEWSSRRKELLAEAELSNGKCSTAQARQNANLRTRQPKGAMPTPDELDRKWRQEAAALGVTPQSLQPALGRTAKYDLDKRMNVAIAEATDACLSDRSYFSRHKFIQAVSEAVQDLPISGVEVARRADRALLRQDLFHAIDAKESREPVYTSQPMWKLEQKLLTTVKELRQSPRATVSQKTIQRALAKASDLSEEQKKAAEFLLESPGRIWCMTGVAGSGKTHMLKVVCEALKKSGLDVYGAALSGAAKEVLADKANIESRTLASYEHHLTKSAVKKFLTRLKHELRMYYRAAMGKSTWRMARIPKLDKRSVLLVDEAGMLDTKYTWFVVQTAKKTGAQILFIGDPKQLSPIGPGGPFKRMIKMVPTCHLAENFRQKSAPDDAQAAADLRDGRVDKMLESYLRRGKLTVAKNRSLAAQQLVSEWAKDGHAKRPEQAIILTQMKSEARHINRLCQSERQLAGQLGQRSVHVHKETFHVGDRVMFHQPLRIKGIENGYQATITAIHPVTQEMSFRLDRAPSAEQKKWGRTQTVKLKPKDIGPDFLTLGYAATTHKMQGQTRAHAYCLMGGSLANQELAYVQITRGEKQTKLFIDRDHAGPKLSQLAETLRTSGEKKLAHDLGLRLRIQKDKGDN
jgi:conjugative relaxase-like TrwC/TraI family protein